MTYVDIFSCPNCLTIPIIERIEDDLDNISVKCKCKNGETQKFTIHDYTESLMEPIKNGNFCCSSCKNNALAYCFQCKKWYCDKDQCHKENGHKEKTVYTYPQKDEEVQQKQSQTEWCKNCNFYKDNKKCGKSHKTVTKESLKENAELQKVQFDILKKVLERNNMFKLKKKIRDKIKEIFITCNVDTEQKKKIIDKTKVDDYEKNSFEQKQKRIEGQVNLIEKLVKTLEFFPENMKILANIMKLGELIPLLPEPSEYYIDLELAFKNISLIDTKSKITLKELKEKRKIEGPKRFFARFIKQDGEVYYGDLVSDKLKFSEDSVGVLFEGDQVSKDIENPLKDYFQNLSENDEPECEGENMYQGGRNTEKKKEGFGIFNFMEEQKKVESYTGYWKNDKKHGKGEYKYSNGDLYEGEWKDNMKHGKGFYFHKDSKAFYFGEWKEGKKNGKGKCVFLQMTIKKNKIEEEINLEEYNDNNNNNDINLKEIGRYEGTFENDNFVEGTYSSESFGKIEGTWRDGVIKGKYFGKNKIEIEL